jgi:two-component sensor histidine kinase
LGLNRTPVPALLRCDAGLYRGPALAVRRAPLPLPLAVSRDLARAGGPAGDSGVPPTTLANALSANLLPAALLAFLPRTGGKGLMILAALWLLYAPADAFVLREAGNPWPSLLLWSASIYRVLGVSARRHSARPPGDGIERIGVGIALAGLATDDLARFGMLPPLLPPTTGIATVLMLVGVQWAFTYSCLEHRCRTREQPGQLVEARRLEQRRVGRDLHDGISQEMLALRLRLQAACAQVRSGWLMSILHCEELVREFSRMLDELRSVTHDLSGVAFQKQTLPALLEEHARRVSRWFGLHVEIESRLDSPIGPETKEHLFRIFQEAVGNAFHHGKASRVRASLRREGTLVRMEVNDNGVGFDAEGIEPRGLGLASIRERARLLGGRAIIRSAPGQGTIIILEVPDAHQSDTRR